MTPSAIGPKLTVQPVGGFGRPARPARRRGGCGRLGVLRPSMVGRRHDPARGDCRVTSRSQMSSARWRVRVVRHFSGRTDALDTRIELSSADPRQGSSTRYALVDLASITAVYQRPYGADRIPALDGHVRGDPAWRHAETLQQTITAWLEITPALVVNRSSYMASNGSKPYQAQIIAAHGLSVPETLITTDAGSGAGISRSARRIGLQVH